MPSILYLIETIYYNIFGYNYLRNEKKFSQFFVAFLKSRFNFEHFEKKDEPHRVCIFELTDSQRGG